MSPTQRKNNESSKSLKLIEIAELVGGELVGEADVVITGVAGIKEAKAGDITFVSNLKYFPFLEKTQASAVITPPETIFPKKPLVRTSNPSQAMTKVISHFFPPLAFKTPGIHATAVIEKEVVLGEKISIGPHVVIEQGCRIGNHSVLEANAFVGAGSVLGEHVWIHPNVTIYEGTSLGDRVIIHSGTVIGGDGFGYETVEGKHRKIPHTGGVVIEEDVEIGSNVSIDRGRFKETWIQKGTKIDNLVQIAHNVVVGPDCLLVSQSGISGSVELGKNVVIAGQAGLVGHISIGDNVIIGAGSGVTKSIPPNTVVLGGPARPIAEQKRIYALIGRLPELFKDLLALKKEK
jgi:UDP-3-O-[3-hydroxymyristoyl] glucosamine N-acyltransferase